MCKNTAALSENDSYSTINKKIKYLNQRKKIKIWMDVKQDKVVGQNSYRFE